MIRLNDNYDSFKDIIADQMNNLQFQGRFPLFHAYEENEYSIFDVDATEESAIADFGPSTVNPNNDPRPPGELGDQSYLFISGGTSNRNNTREKNFFSFEFYQQYFDVDTDQVLSRILHSMLPRFGSNFITDHIQPLPDLWGPFWISVTLVFSTAICGNLAKYIQTSGASTGYQYGSDFRLVTGASTIIFCYVVLVPFVLYSLFWYRKSYLQYSYLDILCAYGYSLSIFVPVSVLWVLQAQWFRWLLIILSVALSGSVLANSIWPAIKNDHNKAVSKMFGPKNCIKFNTDHFLFNLMVNSNYWIALGTILIVLLLHSLVAVGFKEYYFDASLPSKLETENFHLLHQQVQNIEHSHARLEVSSVMNNLTAPNEAEVSQMKMEKSDENNENIRKKEDVGIENMKELNATTVPKVAAKISKPV
uniref:Yip1 domain-containing protein n=1 Tax=Wuchereria bancrofti TaxID=6293 RepID=A0A1I8EX95_WUCBA